MSLDELHLKLKGKQYALIPRFAIVQASNKQRIIDDAAAGGQSRTSRDSNKLHLCAATQPAVHLSILQGAIDKYGLAVRAGATLIGGIQ